jgi:hypothetical protein
MADIRHCIQIAAPYGVVYPLVSTARGLAQWWAADITEADGAVELGSFNKTTVYRFRPQVDGPHGAFEWMCETGDEWSGTRLLFRLEDAGGGTRMRFTHAGWRSETDYFVSCTTTWGELMYRLKAAAEGKSRGPLFLADSLAY